MSPHKKKSLRRHQHSVEVFLGFFIDEVLRYLSAGRGDFLLYL